MIQNNFSRQISQTEDEINKLNEELKKLSAEPTPSVISRNSQKSSLEILNRINNSYGKKYDGLASKRIRKQYKNNIW